MKNLFLIVMMASLMLSCKSKPEETGADGYCDSVINLQNEVILQADSFFQSISHRDINTSLFYENAVKKVNHNLLELKKLGAFRNDYALLLASRNVMQTVSSILENEGKQIVVLDQELLSRYDLEKIEQLDDMLCNSFLRIQQSQSLFDSIQTQFLNKYGFDVEIDTTAIQNLSRELIQ